MLWLKLNHVNKRGPGIVLQMDEFHRGVGCVKIVDFK